jgi:hypothetical protein
MDEDIKVIDTGTFIKRQEELGELDPNCKTCQKIFYPSYYKGIFSVFAPRHKPSPRCKSGKNPHCTCDTCF